MQALTCMATAGFPVDGIIHIGANVGQERFDYLASGANPCIYVEPIDAVFEKLRNHVSGLPGHIAVQAVCSDTVGEEIKFQIASNGGESSSIFPLGAHAELFPSVVYTSTQLIKTTTVDALLAALELGTRPNLMIIDTQGADLKVLKGATTTFDAIDGIFVEVCETPLYEGSCTQDEITEFLKGFGFRLRWMMLDGLGLGEAFYCRRFDKGETLPRYNGNLALDRPAQQSSLSSWSTPNDAMGAVNGQKSGSFGFHTSFEEAPWWEVDLGDSQDLSEIRVYNRILAARERARSLRILVSDDHVSWRQIHDQDNRIFGGVDGRPLRVFCSGTRARYVRLQLNENEETVLHLDEVEIY